MVRSSLSVALILSFTIAFLGFVYFDVSRGGRILPSDGSALFVMPFFDPSATVAGVASLDERTFEDETAKAGGVQATTTEEQPHEPALESETVSLGDPEAVLFEERESLGPNYSKDTEQVYYAGQSILGADPDSFEVLVDTEGDSETVPVSIARDATGLWNRATKVLDIVPATPIALFEAERPNDTNFYFSDGVYVYVHTGASLIRAPRPSMLQSIHAKASIYCTTGILVWQFTTLGERNEHTISITVPPELANGYCDTY